MELQNEQISIDAIDLDPPGLLGLLKRAVQSESKFESRNDNENDIEVQNVEIEDMVSPDRSRDRPPYESLIENDRDSQILTSNPRLFENVLDDSNAFSIMSLDNGFKQVTYDELRETDQLAKYSCYTSFEQLPTDREFEVTVKGVQSIFYQTDKGSEPKYRQTMDLNLLQIIHVYSMQQNHIKEISDQMLYLREQLEQCEIDRNEALKLRARDKVRESVYDQESQNNDQRIQELTNIVQ